MIRLRIYDRNGTTLLGVLPDVLSYQIGVEFSDVGAMSFEYPVKGINADQISDMREIAVITDTGTEVKNGRFVITGIDRDRVESSGTISVTARSILYRLDTALTYPTGGLGSGESTRWFDAKTAGFILKTLIDDAQVRGALSGITYSFTAANDSNSAAWPDTVTQEYPARTPILSVLRSLQEFGIVEVETDARVIRATKTDGIGTDRTTGNTPTILRFGYNLTEAPEKVSADRLATVILAEGDQGLLIERTNSSAVSTYGRIEGSFTASGIDDTAVVNKLGDAYLANAASADRQLTVGLSMQAGAPQPLVDFNVGDYVYTATVAGLERVRVRQITVSMSAGVESATATLGDRIFEQEIKTSRKINAITSGSVTLGNGELPVNVTAVIEADTLAPAAPTSLTGSATGYADGTEPRARVSLTWTAPTTNADGSPLSDLRWYEVQFKRASDTDWTFGGQSADAAEVIENLTVNTSYNFRVFAIDAFNNRSTASSTFTVTTPNLVATETTPSTPSLTTRLGTLSITWDGLGAGGNAMSATFAYLAVHVSTTNNFTPNNTNYVARMTGADKVILTDLAYNTTYYVRFVAYNKAGTSSNASAQASASIVPLVNTDIIDASLSGAKFANGTINTAQLADGSISGSKILTDAITSDKIAANAIGADEIAANAIVAGKIAANAVTAGTIAALAISAGNIQSNAITADKIEAGAITAVKIAANAVTADKIAAGTITTDKLVAGSLTGFTITNGSGFSVSSTGVMNATSGFIGGFAISSGIIGDGNGTYISSSTGFGAFNNVIVRATSGAGISMSGANINTGGGNVNLGSSGSITNGSAGTFSGTLTSGTCSTTTVSASGSITASLDITANRDLYTPNHTTVTDAANGRVTISLGRVTRSTASSQRYKENITPIRDIEELDPKKLLQLPVRAFTYREDYLSESDSRFGALIPGFIAEEVDAVYPVAADYEDGEVESWNDRMIVPGLLALIQDLYARIETLENNA